jgi:DNA-binding Xre family transcriptional regulator
MTFDRNLGILNWFFNFLLFLHTIYINNVRMERKINRIKVMLAEKGKTNKWLSEQVGKDPATVSKWCTNMAQPTLETMMQIAKVLEVDLNDLVRFEALSEIEKKDQENANI